MERELVSEPGGASPDGGAPPRLGWPTLAAAGWLLVLEQCSLYLLAAALPLYLEHLGAARQRIGIETGAASLAAVLCTPLVGPLIDRWGPRRLMLLGTAAYVVAAAGLIALPYEVAAAACRLTQGIASGLILPSALTLAPRLVPARRGMILGLTGSLNTVALAIGPPVGLWLYAFGPRQLFLVAGLCALAGLALVKLLPDVPLHAAQANRVARGQSHQSWRVAYDRRWTAPLLANALTAAYFGGVVAYLPIMLAHDHGPSAGIFFTADAIGVILLSAPSGALVDRAGPRVPQLLGIAVTLGGLAALFFAPSVLTLILAGAGTGIGAGLFTTAVRVVVATRSAEHNRGTAMALSASSGSAGIFVNSALSGLIIGPGGFTGVIVFGALTTLAGLAPVLLDRHAGPARASS
ncbi:MAG TPA: MFS transporter [Ktedonobacterales bacterium]|jgi:MFS family permease